MRYDPRENPPCHHSQSRATTVAYHRKGYTAFWRIINSTHRISNRTLFKPSTNPTPPAIASGGGCSRPSGKVQKPSSFTRRYSWTVTTGKKKKKQSAEKKHEKICMVCKNAKTKNYSIRRGKRFNKGGHQVAPSVLQRSDGERARGRRRVGVGGDGRVSACTPLW